MSSFLTPPEPYNRPTPPRRKASDPVPASFPEPPDEPEQVQAGTYAYEEAWQETPAASSANRRPFTLLLVGALLALVLAVLIPVGLGVYNGTQERQRVLHEQAEAHYQQALTYESEDYMELALAEMRLAVKFDPSYTEAADKLKELEKKGSPSGTPTPDSAKIADQLWSRAQDAVTKKSWSDAIDYLEEIRRADQTYRTDEVTRLLGEAYMAGGRQSLTVGEIEQAKSRFDSVLELDPSNAQAKQLRDRSALYVNGLAQVGTNPQVAVISLQQLYQQDPAFYDVKQQLLAAYIAYGDAAQKTSVCIAAREYDQAVRLGADQEVQDKLAAANASCKQAVLATATPTATPIGTPAAEATPVSTSAPVSNGMVRVKPDNGTTCGISGVVQDAEGNPITNVKIRIYNDGGYDPAPFPVDSNGRYSIVLSDQASMFHLVVLGPNNQPAGGTYDFNYPGGTPSGCHWTIDWIKNP